MNIRRTKMAAVAVVALVGLTGSAAACGGGGGGQSRRDADKPSDTAVAGKPSGAGRAADALADSVIAFGGGLIVIPQVSEVEDRRGRVSLRGNDSNTPQWSTGCITLPPDNRSAPMGINTKVVDNDGRIDRRVGVPDSLINLKVE